MINKLLKISFIPFLFKIASMAVFTGLVYIGLSATSNDAAFLKVLRNTNWANLIVWSYWWPLIIIFSVIFGRVWCLICPIETITTLTSKIGLRKKVPSFLASGWGITILYALILFVGIQGLAIHRDPTRMAFYLIFLASLSIMTGFIFEKNAFCAHLCPVGHLLGIYARLSPFGWRVKNQDICKACKEKSCIHKNYQNNILSKSCGVGLYPAAIEDNTQCILCTGCMKACSKYNSTNQKDRPNPGFRYIGFNQLSSRWEISTSIAFFVLIVSGFVIYEILTEWNVTKSGLLYIPNYLKEVLLITNPVLFGFMKSMLLFLFLPLVIVFTPYLISPLSMKKLTAREYLVAYIQSIVPIMAAAHIGKALLKMSSRMPYFSIIGSDQTGIKTAQGIIDNSISIVYTGPSMIIVLTILLFLVTGIVISLRMVHNINKHHFEDKKPIALYLISFFYGLIFTLTFLFWKLI